MFSNYSVSNRPIIGRFVFSVLIFLIFSACDNLPIGRGNSAQVSLISQVASEQERANLAALQTAEPAKADFSDLYSRFNGGQQVQQPEKRSWQSGDIDRFFYTEQTNETIVEVDAVAVYVSSELIMWVEEGVDVCLLYTSPSPQDS